MSTGARLSDLILRTYYPREMAVHNERDRIAAIDAGLAADGALVDHDSGDEDRS